MRKQLIALSMSMAMVLGLSCQAFASDNEVGLTADDIILNMQRSSAGLSSIEGSISAHVDAAMKQISTGAEMPIKADGNARFKSMENGDSSFTGSASASIDLSGAAAASSGDGTISIETEAEFDAMQDGGAYASGGMMQEMGGNIEAYTTMVDDIQMLVYTLDDGDTWQAQPNSTMDISLDMISEDNLIENNGFFERGEDGTAPGGDAVFTLVHHLTQKDLENLMSGASMFAESQDMGDEMSSMVDVSDIGVNVDDLGIDLVMLVDKVSGRFVSLGIEMPSSGPVTLYSDKDADTEVVLNALDLDITVDSYDSLQEVDIPQGALDAINNVELNDDGSYTIKEIETEAITEDVSDDETEEEPASVEEDEIDPVNAFSHGHMATADGKYKFAYDITGDLNVVDDVDAGHLHVSSSDYGECSASLFMDAFTWDEDTYSAAVSDRQADVDYYTSDPAYSEISITDLTQTTVAGHPAYVYSRQYTSDEYSYVSSEYVCFVDCGDSGYIRILIDDLSDPGSTVKLDEEAVTEYLRHVVAGE